MKITIRPEAEQDIGIIRAVNTTAFGSTDEADIVDALRSSGAGIISLVAEVDGEVCGHILFSQVTLFGSPSGLRLAGLGPMAVAPSRQKRGIGSALAEEGIKECRNQGYGAIFVLGHPGYYPRFGFFPAGKYGIGCQFPAPDEAFMALELSPGYLAEAKGTIFFHPAFGGGT